MIYKKLLEPELPTEHNFTKAELNKATGQALAHFIIRFSQYVSVTGSILLWIYVLYLLEQPMLYTVSWEWLEFIRWTLCVFFSIAVATSLIYAIDEIDMNLHGYRGLRKAELTRYAIQNALKKLGIKTRIQKLERTGTVTSINEDTGVITIHWDDFEFGDATDRISLEKDTLTKLNKGMRVSYRVIFHDYSTIPITQMSDKLKFFKHDKIVHVEYNLTSSSRAKHIILPSNINRFGNL